MGKNARTGAIVVAGTLIFTGLIALILLLRSMITWAHAEIVMLSLLTFATIIYALLVWLSLDQSKEAAVQPKLVLDLVRMEGDPEGAGIRVLNGGNGPAVSLRFSVPSEPKQGKFQVTGLNATKEGLEALPAKEQRVLSTGQSYADLLKQPDRAFDIEVHIDRLEEKPIVTGTPLRLPKTPIGWDRPSQSIGKPELLTNVLPSHSFQPTLRALRAIGRLKSAVCPLLPSVRLAGRRQVYTKRIPIGYLW